MVFSCFQTSVVPVGHLVQLPNTDQWTLQLQGTLLYFPCRCTRSGREWTLCCYAKACSPLWISIFGFSEPLVPPPKVSKAEHSTLSQTVLYRRLSIWLISAGLVHGFRCVLLLFLMIWNTKWSVHKNLPHHWILNRGKQWTMHLMLQYKLPVRSPTKDSADVVHQLLIPCCRAMIDILLSENTRVITLFWKSDALSWLQKIPYILQPQSNFSFNTICDII